MAIEKYEHVLQPKKPGRFPANLWCLGIQDTSVPILGTADERVAHLDRWAAVRMRSLPSDDGDLITGTDQTTDALWSRIYHSISRRYTTWVVVSDPWRTLGELGAWNVFETPSWIIDDVCFRDSTFILSARTPRGKICVVGINNYYRGSFASITEAVHDGIYGQESDPACPSEIGGDVARGTAMVLAYAVSAVCRVFGELGHVTWGASVSTMAWDLWLARFYSHRVHVHADPLATQLEREAYYGGRTEVLTWGRECPDTSILDINSAYGLAMLSYDMPCMLIDSGDNSGPLRRRTSDIYLSTIRRVKIRASIREYPVRRNGRVQWARGTFWTTLGGADLATAEENGDVIDRSQVATYQTAPVLAEYANALWRYRNKCKTAGDVLASAVAKTLTVSLYGKFGQKSTNWTLQPDGVCWRRWGQWTKIMPHGSPVVYYRAARGTLQAGENVGEWQHSFPAIAGTITAECREVVRLYGEKVGLDNVHYYDTDSLHVTPAGLKIACDSELIDTETIGALKVKGQPFTATYWGANDWYGGGQSVSPCLPAGSVQQSPGTFYYQAGPGIASIMDSREKNSVVLRDRVVQLKRRRYDGRTTEAGRVQPLWIEEDSSTRG